MFIRVVVFLALLLVQELGLATTTTMGMRRIEVRPRLASSDSVSVANPDPRVLNLRPVTNRSTRPIGTTPPAMDNNGLIDGVYQCHVTLNGVTSESIISINGKANGTHIYAVGEITPGSNGKAGGKFYGWGLGTINAAGYTGQTWNGFPFSFGLLGLDDAAHSGRYDTLRITGQVKVNATETATLVCRTDHQML